MRVLVHVNTLDRVSSFIYSNHIAFAAHNARKFNGPNDKFFWFSPHRMAIDTARNEAAKQAMGLECDYLMFIDDDVLIPPDAFEKLMDTGTDIAAGLVYLRGYPFHVMAFTEAKREWLDDGKGNKIEDPRFKLRYYDEIHQKTMDGEKIIPCAAVGFSCCLISVDVLRALEAPYFVTGPLNTEDVYFCMKTRHLTPVPTISVNTDVRCGHLLNPEPIEFDTKLLLTNFYDNLAKKFEDTVNPDGVPLEDHNPRNLAYIERNLQRL